MATTTAEEAVRNYLRYLHGDGALEEAAGVAELRERLDASDDPVERLQLHAQIAQASDPKRFEDEFVTHAASWARSEGIGPEAFEAEGVDRGVLRRAGLLKGRGRSSRRSASQPRVGADEVRKAIPARKKFTLRDLQQQTGASSATVRNTVQGLVSQGAVEDLGPDPNHSGRGRAPKVYKRA